MERQLSKKQTPPQFKEKSKGETSVSTPLFSNLTSYLSPNSLRQIYRETNVVRRCIEDIALDIASLPREYDVQLGVKKQEVIDLLFGRETATGETFRDVLIAATIDLLVLNKGVLVPLTTFGGKLTGFTARDAATFHPVYEVDGTLRGYIQQVSLGKVYTFKPSELVFIQLVPHTYKSEGISLLEALTYEVASLLKNLAKSDPDTRKPIGVFVFHEEVSEDVISRFQDDLTSLVSGNRVKVPVLWGVGKGEWLELVKQFDIQMVATFMDRLDWLVRSAFGFVPPGSSLQSASAGQELLFSTLTPRIAQAISTRLNAFLKPYGVTFTFKIPPAHTLDKMIEGVKSGLISPNEARQFMRLPAVRGGGQLSVMQPQGLTPVGTTGKKPSTTVEELPLSLGEVSTDLFRNVSLEEAQEVRNLALLPDEATVKFVLERIRLLDKMRADLKELTLAYRASFEEETLLRQTASALPPYSKFLLDLSTTMDQYRDTSLDLGFARVAQYWKLHEYDKEAAEKEILDHYTRLQQEALRGWRDRLGNIHKEAKRGEWDQVKRDFDNLMRSILAIAGFVTLFANLPLVVVSKFFQDTEGVMLRWEGVQDNFTCTDCAALQGKQFKPSTLELLQTWPGYGVRCGHNCRCVLVPTSAITEASVNKWIGKVVNIKNLHVPSEAALAMYLNVLEGVDKKIVNALKEVPQLREPAYASLFTEIKLTPRMQPTFDAVRGVLEIPESYSAEQIRTVFIDATATNILLRYNLMSPTSPFSAALSSIQKGARELLWYSYLRDFLPNELKEAWLKGDASAFKGLTANLFDFPAEAYFDTRKFFTHMFRASILMPHRTDIPGMEAFRELLASQFWSPTTYERWLNRVYKVRPIPWRATLSSSQVIDKVSYVDPAFQERLREILDRYSSIRVSSFWDGLKGIKLTDASRYDATYSLDGTYKDFVRSFNGEIKTTDDPFQFLHELGHHVFERHFVVKSHMRDSFAYVYRERFLIPFYEQALPYLKEEQAQKFMGYMNAMLDATEQHQLGSFFLGTRDYFRDQIFKPIYPTLQSTVRNWALPIRLYSLQGIDESFAEAFATFITRPSVLYFSDPELYFYMESLLQNVAVKPETFISKHPAWQRVFEALAKTGLTRRQIKQLSPQLLWAFIREDVSPEEMVGLFEVAATEEGSSIREQIKDLVNKYAKAPQKKKMPSTEKTPPPSTKPTVPKTKMKVVTLKDIQDYLLETLKVKKSKLPLYTEKLIALVTENKMSLVEIEAKLKSFKTKKEARAWLNSLLKK